jgi:ApaG protein
MSYEAKTQGIRVRVQPDFSLAQSDPTEGRFVFTYQIEVDNEGDDEVQLMFRHWHIHDSGGEDSEVDGEGVVGEQPRLLPGASHSYQSFCILRSPMGFMEGHFTFVNLDGREFEVAVPKFDLEAPWGGFDAEAEMN